ncbi:50S ribosome-binding GTPase [Isoptericola sp. NEAU-Y5]|uniref:50S ribosome-binding GTPase n=1 Tax=Isoptericola luteus TaxID=2879484 RepID=A0ABS7ZIC2_9MICO|nr:dynamin family protein [Isoptericola sp. NEAU-Y5]MCA5893349.1 50S ribosome-binding GTPase [Isoptericola sp. NEAU-Y5]
MSRTGAHIDLADRTSALETAVGAAEGRLDVPLLDDARAVAQRARERGGLSADHTVVALAGATGSGKSSVLNAVAGSAVATVGVRRPTTAHAVAAVWGDGAGPLLDWLEVRRRHEVQAPELDDGAGASDPAPPPRPTPLRTGLARLRRTSPPAGITTGLVLLDLPDHDSVVTEHRVRAERLVERADLLVWVVDPQKYADAALHERYLRPLAGRAEVVVVVLNQVDRLAADEVDALLADLRRLVVADGLDGARVLALSARTGQGVDQLKGLLAEAAARREAATARLTADLRAVAQRIEAACGPGARVTASGRAATDLVDALEDAAGVPTVVDAVAATHRRDAHLATGWPPTRWVSHLRRDPLRRLGLRRGGPGGPGGPGGTGGTVVTAGGGGHGPAEDRPELIRSSLPTARPAVRAAAATAVRRYVDSVTDQLPDAWALAVRERGQEPIDRLPGELDQAVVGTRLEAARRPRWWAVAGAVQWLLLVVAVAGLLWLAAAAAVEYFRLPSLILPVLTVDLTASGGGVLEVPWPTLLALGGLLGGLLLALVSRGIAAWGARRRAARVRKALRDAVARVGDRLVRLPVGNELAALADCRTAASIAAS